jgi:serine/threonine protein kinase
MKHHPNYEIFEELGRGEHTIVYRGYDLNLGREVAVKVLPDLERHDARSRGRFLRQAQFLAQHDHDHVLRVHSVEPELGWIIMELMQDTIASRIGTSPCEPDVVRSILKQILSALAFLHEKQKIHGSIRPSNILINDQGRVKLSDFEEVNAEGELLAPTGSKKYLAPELIRPEFGRCGPGLDLYCLAFTAYELLAGSAFDNLFPGTDKGAIDIDLAWLRWHNSDEEFPSLASTIKQIPEDLAHVLQHMLKKQVAQRPASAKHALQELADRPMVWIPIRKDISASQSAAPAATTVRELAPLANAQRNSQDNIAAANDVSRPATHKAIKKPLRGSTSLMTKEGWNQVLGKSSVLYPLCALLFAGIVWGGWPRPKPESTKKNLPIVELPTDLVATKTPKVVPSVDVLFQISPHDAELLIGEKKYPLVQGEGKVSLKGNPLSEDLGTIENIPWKVSRRGFETQSGIINMITTESELSSNPSSQTIQVSLTAKLPTLPPRLTPKPDSPLHVYWHLPERALVTALEGQAPMEMILVSPGEYSIGVPSKDAFRWELSAKPIRIELPFYLAVHETTIKQFEIFASSGKSPPALSSRDGRQSDSPETAPWESLRERWKELLGPTEASQDLPVTGVSPWEAEAFCHWIGGRLPSESEWESAMRGQDNSGFPYPWRKRDGFLPTNCQLFRGATGRPHPVSAFDLPGGMSPLGFFHGIGNAAEWCRQMDSDTEVVPVSGPLVPTDRLTLADYTIRGCSFATPEGPHARITWRSTPDMETHEDVGFRAAVFPTIPD